MDPHVYASGVVAFSDDDVWVTGLDSYANDGGVWHYDGVQATPVVPFGSVGRLRAIHADRPQHLVAAGDSVAVTIFNGVALPGESLSFLANAVVALPGPVSVSLAPSPQDLSAVAVGSSGQIEARAADAGTISPWVTFTDPLFNGQILYGVGGPSAGDLWAVGTSGTIGRRLASGWASVNLGQGAGDVGGAVVVAQGHVWIGGSFNGVPSVLRTDGGSATRWVLPADAGFAAWNLAVDPSDQVWVAGSRGWVGKLLADGGVEGFLGGLETYPTIAVTSTSVWVAESTFGGLDKGRLRRYCR